MVLPIISKSGEKVKQTSENRIEIEKPEATVIITSNAPIKIKEMKNERIFNQVPGVEVLPLLMFFTKDVTEVSCTIEVI